MVWGWVAGKVLGKSVAKKRKGRQDAQNPYYEYKPLMHSDGTPSRSEFEKKKKKPPPGLADHEQKAFQKFKDRAYNLDMRFGQSCGTAVVIGAVPGIGDVLVIIIALSLLLDVRRASHVHFGIYNWWRLLLNVGVDGVVGLIPFLGDIFDAFYKCNTRNAVRLERIFRKQGQKRLAKEPGADDNDPRQRNYRHEEPEDENEMGEVIRGPRPTVSDKASRKGRSTRVERDLEPELEQGHRVSRRNTERDQHNRHDELDNTSRANSKLHRDGRRHH